MSKEDTTKKIKLNLGCWKDYKKGWINVDIDKTVKTDILADLDKRFPFPDNYADEIKCNGIYEHISNPYHFMSELIRVSKKGCNIYMRVPYWKSAEAFTCPDHKRYCTFHTFDHWSIKKGYDIISISDEPTWIGKLFPSLIRMKLSFIIGGLIDFVVFRLKVTK